jgi:cytochrome oxidase Cu insertion factor (SCO1/SenC/PrrC family)
VLAIALLGPAPGGAHEGEGHAAEAAASAPGADGAFRFEAPAPGSYALPPIAHVEDHRLLDAEGRPVPLLDLAPGELAFVSFVYLSCADACPAATATLQQLDRRLAASAPLADAVELVTVSFDPARDTPAAMGTLARNLAPRGRWRFLTAPDAAAIAPVLEDFGQDVVALSGPDGTLSGPLQHVLKVFLVDAEGRVRNVYSTDFLDVRLLENDARTLLLE